MWFAWWTVVRVLFFARVVVFRYAPLIFFYIFQVNRCRGESGYKMVTPPPIKEIDSLIFGYLKRQKVVNSLDCINEKFCSFSLQC